MHRAVRIVSVTLGLALLGAAAGVAIVFVGHVAIMLTTGARSGNWAIALRGAFSPALLAFLLPKGALLGALTGPAVAWAFLRRVPVGSAALGTAVGALVGGVAGDLTLSALFWGRPSPIRFGWLWCALVGVLLAAVVLRRRFRNRKSSDPIGPAANEALQLTGRSAAGSVPASPDVGVRPRPGAARS